MFYLVYFRWLYIQANEKNDFSMVTGKQYNAQCSFLLPFYQWREHQWVHEAQLPAMGHNILWENNPNDFPPSFLFSHYGLCNMIFIDQKETDNLKLEGDTSYLSKVILHKEQFVRECSHLFCGWHEFFFKSVLYKKVRNDDNNNDHFFKFLLSKSIVLVFRNIISFNLHDTLWDRG